MSKVAIIGVIVSCICLLLSTLSGSLYFFRCDLDIVDCPSPSQGVTPNGEEGVVVLNPSDYGLIIEKQSTIGLDGQNIYKINIRFDNEATQEAKISNGTYTQDDIITITPNINDITIDSDIFKKMHNQNTIDLKYKVLDIYNDEKIDSNDFNAVLISFGEKSPPIDLS